MAAVSRLLSFLCCLIVIINFITQAYAQPLDKQFCGQDNFTINSAYHTNLKTLLSTLTSNNEINYGFYNLSYGENSDKVYAIGLCRGDIKADKCRSCLNNAKTNLTQHCPNQKEAIGWYEDETCMLRYSNRSIFGLKEIGPAYFVWNTNNATDADEFNKDVKSLLESLKSRAASGDSRRKYATAMARGPNNQTIYGLVQCTPDLSRSDCASCLNQSISVDIPSCCNNRIGARVVRPSCYMRYETSPSPFYEAATDAPSPSPSSSTVDAPPPPSTSDAPLPTPPSTDTLPPPPQPLSLPPSPNSQGISNKSRTAIGFFLLLLCSFLYTS